MSENDLGNLLSTIATAEGLKITKGVALRGGSTNHVFFLETTSGQKVIKLNHNTQFPDMFQAEKDGLEILKKSKTFVIPEVFSCGKSDNTAYLLLGYIPQGDPGANFWKYFAEKLAKLHHNSNAYFGFSTSNYIGSLPQFNENGNTAAEFYISQRLEPQFRLAVKNRFAFKDLEVILKNIEKEIPNEPPALIHGDLWHGNCLINQNGLPCLIDPAVCFGPREMDLAMMKLFGGFPLEVFSIYQEIFPMLPGFEKRVPLWQLYYLLVHLNIFGKGYYRQVSDILKQYE